MFCVWMNYITYEAVVCGLVHSHHLYYSCVVYHTRISHVLRVGESWHTHQGVVRDPPLSHLLYHSGVSHTNESYLVCGWRLTSMSHGTHINEQFVVSEHLSIIQVCRAWSMSMNELYHIYEWVTSHVWMSRVLREDDLWHTRIKEPFAIHRGLIISIIQSRILISKF